MVKTEWRFWLKFSRDGGDGVGVERIERSTMGREEKEVVIFCFQSRVENFT